MSDTRAASVLLAAVPGIVDVEPWVISGVILGGSLLAICVLYVVVRFRQPGDEP